MSLLAVLVVVLVLLAAAHVAVTVVRRRRRAATPRDGALRASDRPDDGSTAGPTNRVRGPLT